MTFRLYTISRNIVNLIFVFLPSCNSLLYNELALLVHGLIQQQICEIVGVIAISAKGVCMRIKEAFLLFPRKLKSGKIVFYYQCYDDDGNRSSGLSTGQLTKTAARAYCMRLYREGRLFPSVKWHVPTFGEYAQGWWEWDTCEYLRNQKGRKDITKAYADNCKTMIKNQVLPYFGKMPLDRITSRAQGECILFCKSIDLQKSMHSP